jgi:hypothetical protein
MPAVAEEVAGAELDRGIKIFSQRSQAHGGVPWSLDDVQGEAGLRLYRAIAEAHSVLAKDGSPDYRVAVDVALD